MRSLFILIVVTFLSLKGAAQEKIFNYEVSSITENGDVWNVPKGDSYSLITASGKKGQVMYMMVGRDIISTGSLLLVSKSEKKETSSQYGGYTMVYSWDRTTQDNVSLPTKVTMRVKFTNAETEFSCELKTSKGTYIYQGVVYDISKPQ